MFRYGFELEGFLEKDNQVITPPHDFPVDGFPGLVELRNFGGNSLEDSYSKILTEYLRLPKNDRIDNLPITVNFSKSEHVFSGKDMQHLRAHAVFDKSLLNVKNIYGRSPRRLGNKTLASLQVNISNELYSAWVDKEGVSHPARFGLLDVHNIISNLDEEFEEEIKLSKRQPGMYAIKDEYRLEYRSLPNFVFKFAVNEAEEMIDRIKSAVEE